MTRLVSTGDRSSITSPARSPMTRSTSSPCGMEPSSPRRSNMSPPVAASTDHPSNGSHQSSWHSSHALGIIARSQNMSELARRDGMSRDGLDNALSADDHPTWSTMLTNALALRAALGSLTGSGPATSATSTGAHSTTPVATAGASSSARSGRLTPRECEQHPTTCPPGAGGRRAQGRDEAESLYSVSSIG